MSEDQLNQIFVEVSQPRANPVARNARSQLDPGTTYTSGGRLDAIFSTEAFAPDEFGNSLSVICAAIGKAMREASPDAWTVEFSLGFKAGAKVPILVSSELNGVLKVSLSWKKPV